MEKTLYSHTCGEKTKCMVMVYRISSFNYKINDLWAKVSGPKAGPIWPYNETCFYFKKIIFSTSKAVGNKLNA